MHPPPPPPPRLDFVSGLFPRQYVSNIYYFAMMSKELQRNSRIYEIKLFAKKFFEKDCRCSDVESFLSLTCYLRQSKDGEGGKKCNAKIDHFDEDKNLGQKLLFMT